MLAIALLALISLGSAARGWTSIWQGFDQLTMGVDDVTLAEDESSAEITVSFTNRSNQVMRIHALETGLRLSGRSISAGNDRYNDLVLSPGEEVTLHVNAQITRFDRDYVRERLAQGGDLTWNVNGRVSVSVEDLSDSLWLPFRVDLSVDQ